MNDVINEFADNPDPRVACVLVLDTSSSMANAPINALNSGMALFEQAIKENELTRMRLEVAIVSFSDKAHVVQDFISANDFKAPTLKASGYTAMGGGINKALSLLKNRRRLYRDNNINTFKPFFFLITDGYPTDSWERAASDLVNYEARTGTHVFPIGVQSADFDVLQQLTKKREPAKLNGLAFEKFFEWVSESMQNVSNSTPGEQTAMAPLNGWANIDS